MKEPENGEKGKEREKERLTYRNPKLVLDLENIVVVEVMVVYPFVAGDDAEYLVGRNC